MLLMTSYSEAELKQVDLMDTYQNPEVYTKQSFVYGETRGTCLGLYTVKYLF